jgi:hypothetical protein
MVMEFVDVWTVGWIDGSTDWGLFIGRGAACCTESTTRPDRCCMSVAYLLHLPNNISLSVSYVINYSPPLTLPQVHACSWHHDKLHASRCSDGRCLVLDSDVRSEKAIYTDRWMYIILYMREKINVWRPTLRMNVSLSICLVYYPDFALARQLFEQLCYITAISIRKRMCEGYLWNC